MLGASASIERHWVTGREMPRRNPPMRRYLGRLDSACGGARAREGGGRIGFKGSGTRGMWQLVGLDAHAMA
jgi:hypothetical protein